MRWAQWSFIMEASGISFVFITQGSAFYMFCSLAPEGELWCLAGQGSWGLLVEVFTSFLNCAVFVSRVAVWPVQGEHLHIWSFHQSHRSPRPPLPCHYSSTPALPTFCSSSASRRLRTHLCTFPPTQPLSLKPEKHFFFQWLPYSISLPQYSLSIPKWQWGSTISLYAYWTNKAQH